MKTGSEHGPEEETMTRQRTAVFMALVALAGCASLDSHMRFYPAKRFRAEGRPLCLAEAEKVKGPTFEEFKRVNPQATEADTAAQQWWRQRLALLDCAYDHGYAAKAKLPTPQGEITLVLRREEKKGQGGVVSVPGLATEVPANLVPPGLEDCLRSVTTVRGVRGTISVLVTPLAGVGDADDALIAKAIECFGAAGYAAIEHKKWMDEGDDVDPFASRR